MFFRYEKTEVYERNFQKIDAVLGSVFGLIGLITLILKFLLYPYNKWASDRYVLNCLSKKE